MAILAAFDHIKVFRDCIPEANTVLCNYLKICSRVAYHDGFSCYKNHRNFTAKNSWTGGIVGLKSILRLSKEATLKALDELQALGYIKVSVQKKVYTVTVSEPDFCPDMKHNERSCVYATSGYGFFFVRRNLGDRLAESGYKFAPADALIDLWLHTTYEEKTNIFSMFAPCVRYGTNAALTLDFLGDRWNWEKYTVSRFFKKYSDLFTLVKLPSNFGSVIFNRVFPARKGSFVPSQEKISCIIRNLRRYSGSCNEVLVGNEMFNALVLNYSAGLFSLYVRASKKKKSAEMNFFNDISKENRLYHRSFPNKDICTNYYPHYKPFVVIIDKTKKPPSTKLPILKIVNRCTLQVVNKSELSPYQIDAIEKEFKDFLYLLFPDGHSLIINVPF